MIGLQALGSILGDTELRKLFTRVASRKVSADLKTLQAHAELSRRLSDNRRRSAGGSEANLKLIVREHLEYYSALVELSYNFHQRLLDLLDELGKGPGADSAINALTLTLRAPAGATVRSPFKISNNRPEAINVVCRSSPFVSEDGSQLIASPIAFDPPGAEIQPGAEEIFEVIIPVGADFIAGRTYFATLAAEGLDAMQIVARLTVEETRAEAPKAAAPTKKTARPAAAPSQPKRAPTRSKRPPVATKRRTAKPKRAG
jgi:hypothetical protein